MREKNSKRALILQGLTSKWVIIGVLIAGVMRIGLAIVEGNNITDAIGVTLIGVVLAFLAYVIFHKTFNHNRE